MRCAELQLPQSEAGLQVWYYVPELNARCNLTVMGIIFHFTGNSFSDFSFCKCTLFVDCGWLSGQQC